MASKDAQNVAREVLETMGKGQKVVLGKILKKNGYSAATSKNPKQVVESKSYQDIVNPVLREMMVERDRAMAELKKKISKAKYRDLVDAMDKLTKNIQLLNGGETERTGLKINFDPTFKK